jgi:hypothetical protein
MAEQGTTGEPAQAGPVHRLTFDYDGDRISLTSDQVVNMVVPPSEPLDATTPAGFSIVVRDTRDRLLYRRTGSSPIRHDAEVFSDDPSRSLRRVPVEQRRGTFVVLVPHVEGGASVELVGPTRDRHGSVGEPRSLARFVLRPPNE